VFAGDLTQDEVAELLDRFLSRAQRCRIPEFVTLGCTIREHRHGILEAIRLGLSNARAEALNAKIRLIIRRARGFHSVPALQGLIMLCCGQSSLRFRTRNNQTVIHTFPKGLEFTPVVMPHQQCTVTAPSA
jgi:transposase